MRYEVRHELEYRYSSPVFLEPHTIYLKPRENPDQRVIARDIEVRPTPKLSTHMIDPLGNDALRVWFEGAADLLLIRSRFEVDVDRTDPFSYVAEPSFTRLPGRYGSLSEQELGPYLGKGEVFPQAVAGFAHEIAVRAGSSTLAFLPELCRTIHGSFRRIHRPDGAPWPAERTLESRQGSCRDLAMFFVDCCRSQGLAARFVSGYFEGDPEAPEKELHAWAEVYVEGGGWRGFDPTHGLAAADGHIVIAAAPSAERVSPVIGTYRGDASSTLRARVEIRRSLNVR